MFTKLKIKSLTKRILGLQKARENSPVDESELKKERDAILQLAAIYAGCRFNKKFPMAEYQERECHRLAAQLEHAESAYLLAEKLILRGRYWDEMKNGIFISESVTNYAKQAYDEGLLYLLKAESAGHVLAKRLHGLCYINGWGLPTDLDRGFQLVVASIEQAGAWSEATEIMKELGLNKPEFFSYIMSNKTKS